jgi:PhnB protein
MTEALPQVLGGVAPYLGVSDAGKAADFYVKALGATEVLRMPTRRAATCTSIWW